MAKMGADSLKNNLTNPARVYLWEVLFANPIGGGNGDVLDLRCQTTSIPGRSVGSILIPFKATAGVVFPGKVAFSHEWACAFVEGTDGAVFDALYQWFEEISEANSGQGNLDNSIKTDLYLSLIDQEGNVYRRIKLVGCYIKTMDDTPLPYGEEGAVMFNATFSYDRWEKKE